MDEDDDVMRSALRGLRRDSLRASRRREPALMVSIGLAEPEEDDEDEESEGDDSATRRGMNENYGQGIRKLPATDTMRRQKQR